MKRIEEQEIAQGVAAEPFRLHWSRRGAAQVKTRGRLCSRTVIGCLVSVVSLGCAGDARVELAAADSIELLAANLATTLTEYHTGLERSDDARERAAVFALVERLRADMADEDKTEAHTNDFLHALDRLHADRRIEWQRFIASMDNLSVLRETANGLRRLAIESLSLEDEAQRYFGELIELRRARETKPENESGP